MHTVVETPAYLADAKRAGMPVFLLSVYSKGERANLSKAECNELKGILSAIVREYKKGGPHRV